MTAKKTNRIPEVDPLIQAITQKLAAQDHASRLKRATAMAATMFPETVSTVSPMQNPTDCVIQDDLGQDPGDKAVGMLGSFWDDPKVKGSATEARLCVEFDSDDHMPYMDNSGTRWRHFRHIPTSSEALQHIKDYVE